MIELISIHIAKTGGRSFYEILKQQYGDSLDPRYKRVHYFPRKNYHNKLINRIPENTKVLHGHLFFEHVKEIYERFNPKIITWFRDPVERVISNYYYLMGRLREDDQHPQFKKKDFTLVEYAQDSLKNKMSRYLNGIDLEELFFFGFLENFDDGIIMLSDKLGWKYPIEEVHINESKESVNYSDIATQRSDINEEIREIIKELNQEDIELYKRARELYKKNHA